MSVRKQDIKLLSAQIYLCLVFLLSWLWTSATTTNFPVLFKLCFHKYLKPTPFIPAETEYTDGYRIKKIKIFNLSKRRRESLGLLHWPCGRRLGHHWPGCVQWALPVPIFSRGVPVESGLGIALPVVSHSKSRRARVSWLQVHRATSLGTTCGHGRAGRMSSCPSCPRGCRAEARAGRCSPGRSLRARQCCLWVCSASTCLELAHHNLINPESF